MNASRVPERATALIARWRAAARPRPELEPLAAQLYPFWLAAGVALTFALQASTFRDPLFDDDLVWFGVPAAPFWGQWVDLANPRDFSYYRPLGKLLYRAVYRTVGIDDPLRIHLIGCALWSGFSLATARLLRVLGASRVGAALAAWILAANAGMWWVVKWPSCWPHALAATFGVLALARAMDAPARWRTAWLVPALFAAGLASSEAAAAVPVLLVIGAPLLRIRDGTLGRPFLVATGLTLGLLALYTVGKALDPDAAAAGRLPGAAALLASPLPALAYLSPGAKSLGAALAGIALLSRQRVLAATLFAWSLAGLYPGVLQSMDRMAYHVPFTLVAGAGFAALCIARVVQILPWRLLPLVALVAVMASHARETAEQIGDWTASRVALVEVHRRLHPWFREHDCLGGEPATRFLPRGHVPESRRQLARAVHGDYLNLCVAPRLRDGALRDFAEAPAPPQRCGAHDHWLDPSGYLAPCSGAAPPSTAAALADACPGPLPTSASFRSAERRVERHRASGAPGLLAVCRYTEHEPPGPAAPLAPEHLGREARWESEDSGALVLAPGGGRSALTISLAADGEPAAHATASVLVDGIVRFRETLEVGERRDLTLPCATMGLVSLAHERGRPRPALLRWSVTAASCDG